MAARSKSPKQPKTSSNGNGQHRHPFPDFMTLNRIEALQQRLQSMTANASFRSKAWDQGEADPRRDVEDECGYPRLGEGVSVDLMRQLYDRQAVAARVVECLPEATWQATPEVVEDEDADNLTQFEAEWIALGQGLCEGRSWHDEEQGSAVWDALKRLDILSGIGSFGVLLILLDDGKPLDQPADGVMQFDPPSRTEDISVVGDVEEEDEDEGEDLFAKEEETPEGEEEKEPTENINPEGCNQHTGPGCGSGGEKLKPSMQATKKATDLSKAAGVTDKYVESQLKNAEAWAGKKTAQGHEIAAGIHESVAQHHRNEQHARRDHFAGSPSGQGLSQENPSYKHQEAAEAHEAAARKHKEVAAKKREKPPTSNRRTFSNLLYGRWSDSPMTERQEQAILNETNWRQRVWNHEESKWEFRAKPLRDHEKKLVANWAKEREAVRNKVVPHATKLDKSSTQGINTPDGGQGQQQYLGVQFGQTEYPADEPAKKQVRLNALMPFDESQVQVVRYEWNVNNPRFGKPITYRIDLNDSRDNHGGIGLPLATVMVHWSRILHVADNRRNGTGTFGVPRMRPVLDNLLGLRKVYGADPEGYWRASVMKLFLETHPQLGGDVVIDYDALKDDMEKMENSLQQWMATTGLSAKAIPPGISDPTPHTVVQITAICIKLGIPMRVFMGSERGELASSQDDSQWNDVVRARQNLHVGPHIVAAFVNRLIQLGVLSEPRSFRVKWPDLDSLSAKDKAAVFAQRMAAYASYVSGGVEALIDPINMLTREAGFEQEEAQEIIDSAASAQEEKMAEQQLMAEEQGLEVEPPPGMVDPDQKEKDHEVAMAQAEAGGGKPGGPGGFPPKAGGPPKPGGKPGFPPKKGGF